MSESLLMMDSGAFSVHTQGQEIDIDDYIGFCKSHPGVSYYVNLDAIPGEGGDSLGRTRTTQAVEESCKKSWSNYMRMIRQLPEEKVIPVFHRGENLKWLEKYIDFGVPYIGFGQTGMGGRESQKAYLKTVKPFIMDSSGKLTVKTHGFAVTSFDLMTFMPWHSVDSASWIKQGAFGVVYVPRMGKNGECFYRDAPDLLYASVQSPRRNETSVHIDTLHPYRKDQVMAYLKSLRIRIGKSEIAEVSSGYKKAEDELWWDKTKTKVVRIIEPGITNSHHHRFRANAAFIKEANRFVDVDHIYFAGGEGSVDERVEFRLERRLMSFFKVGMCSKKAKSRKAFERWCQMVEMHQKGILTAS